jgi:hypothetical protein
MAVKFEANGYGILKKITCNFKEYGCEFLKKMAVVLTNMAVEFER